MKKRALILLGHQQAMVNFCALFKSIGVDTFAPPFISDEEKNYESTYREHSTILNEELTNRYNLFNKNMSKEGADAICNIIASMNFDFIISYFFVPEKLNLRLMDLNCPKYFLIWGDGVLPSETGYEGLAQFNTKFINSNSSRYIFCHKHLLPIATKNLPTNKFAQLNIPIKDMCELENSWACSDESNNKVLIVCSRVFSRQQTCIKVLASCRDWLLSLCKANPDIEFVLVGKDNSNIPNGMVPENLSVHECGHINEVFSFMQRCKLMFNFHPILLGVSNGLVIQYSQIEASCIGIPILHCSTTRITDHIGFNSEFIFEFKNHPHLYFDHQSASIKLQNLLTKSRVKLKQLSSYQSSLYNNYKISNIKHKYLSSFF